MLSSDFSPEKLMRQRFVKRQADLRESIRVVDAQPPLAVNGWRITFLFDNEKAREMPFINAARKLKWDPNAIIVRSGKVRITVTIKKALSAAEAVMKATKLLPNLEEATIEVKSLDEVVLNRRVTISFPNVGKRVEAMKAAVAQGWTTEKEITSFSFSDVRFEAKGSKPLGKLATLMKKFRGSVSNSQLPHGGITGQGGSSIVKPS